MNRSLPSRHRLPLTALSAGVGLWLACGWAGAQLVGSFRYQPDGRVGLSVRNEMDAASARARRWLVATQLENGAWESTNACGATALAALALGGGGEADVAASMRAIAWLRGLPDETLAAALPEERAWRRLALVVSGEAVPEEEPADVEEDLPLPAWAVENLSRIENGAPLRSPSEGVLPEGWLERLAFSLSLPAEAGQRPSVREALAAELASAFQKGGMPVDSGYGACRQRWFLAHFLNVCCNGILVDADTAMRLPWREEVAGRLVAEQRVDPEHPGAGYWQGGEDARAADWAAGAVPETAFAILALDEL